MSYTSDLDPLVLAAVESATPSVGHAPRPVDPTAGPTQLSSKHPNAVNYAISAGGVLVGVAFITTFALICRWRKRRRQRALDSEIDERIREKSLSRLEASRTHGSLAKLPAAALAADSVYSHSLPRLTGPSHSGLSNADTVPGVRQTCIRSSGQRLPCGCPGCLTPAGMSNHPHSGSESVSGSTSRSSSPHPTIRYSPFSTSRQPSRPAVVVSSVRSSSSASSTRGRRSRRTDENAHRAASVRTPPTRASSPYPRPWDLDTAVVPQTYRRGVGVGIMVATRAGSLGCPSPVPSTPSLAFSTPRIGSSHAGSPALSLSDDAGATTLSPITFSPSTPRQPASPTHPRSSVDQASSLGRLDTPLVHMQVSPLIQEWSSPAVPPRANFSPAQSSATIDHWETPNQSMSDAQDHAATSHVPKSVGTTALLPDPMREEQGQKWFTDVDWYGTEGPLACFDQPASTDYSTGSWHMSGRA